MEDLSTMVFLMAACVLLIAVAYVLAHRQGKGGVHCDDCECLPDEGLAPSAGEADDAYALAVEPCASGVAVMYTLHTCVHCKHLKVFLDEHGVECRLVYVDDFEGERRREVVDAHRRFNPRGSFPTLVLPDGRVAVGFRKAIISEMLGLNA